LQRIRRYSGRKRPRPRRKDGKHGGLPFAADRRADRGTGRLARRHLARVRELVKAADPEVEETWKWRGVPVWEHDGIICTGETYKEVVKLTFAKGASLPDPAGLFNSSLEGNTRRAIDIHEDDDIDEDALKALIRAAVDLNTGG
jgi:hypothetical protein